MDISGNGGIIGTINNSKQVNIKNCNNYSKITGIDNQFGGIVGTVSNGCYVIIDGCLNEGVVENVGETNSVCGGILGNLPKGTVEIKSCGNKAEVLGRGDKGGIVGCSCGSSWSNRLKLDILNSYNIGNVTSSNGNVGGIVGSQETICEKNEIYIENSFTSGELTGNKKGAILANRSTSDKTEQQLELKNVYYNKDDAFGTQVNYSTEGAIIKTEQQMKSEDFLKLLNSNIGSNTSWKSWKTGENAYPTFK